MRKKKGFIAWLAALFDCITPQGIWIAFVILLSMVGVGYLGYTVLLQAYINACGGC